MRDAIPFLGLIGELIKDILNLEIPKLEIRCTLFEDNNGALELAKQPRYRPRTKHIALKYHHFQSWIKSGKCTVLPIYTKEQIADQFTKGIDWQTFAYLRKQICGW